MRFCLLPSLLMVLLVPPLQAQEVALDGQELSASGTEYLRATRLRGIDTRVVYYDPTRPAPPLDTSQDPKPERAAPDGDTITTSRWVVTLLSALILAGLLALILRHSGGVSLTLRDAAANPTRRAGTRSTDDTNAPRTPASLDALLRISDRREALVLLTQKALATALDANGILMQRSWTARDALRRLPAEQPHRGALQALVLASEFAQFGGRAVSEDAFRDHVSQISPLLRQTPGAAA